MNTGFIYSPPNPSDFLFGGESSLGMDVLQADRDWTPFLPVFESQSFKFFDPMACVSYSAMNCLEILLKRHGEEVNFNDRFTAKKSGTTPSGNTFSNVADSIRRDGLILETDYATPFDLPSRDVYYQDIGQELTDKAKEILVTKQIGTEWVPTDVESLFTALQHSPIQLAWFYGKPNADGTYPKYPDKGNHAVALVKADHGKSWTIFDSYGPRTLKELAWDSLFWGALRYTINDKQVPNKPMPNFIEGTMYQLVEGHGGAFLFSRGQMLSGDEAKVLFAWSVMNGGDINGKVGRLLLNDLKGLQLYDMGRHPIPNSYV